MTDSVCILKENKGKNNTAEVKMTEGSSSSMMTTTIVPVKSMTTRCEKRHSSLFINSSNSSNNNNNSHSQSKGYVSALLPPQLPFKYTISRKEVVIWAINRMAADEILQELLSENQKKK